MTLLNKLLIVAGMILFILTFIMGCEHGKKSVKCPVITTDTITHVDTVEYHIKDTVKFYVKVPGTIIYVKVPVLPTKEDTARILKDFYALHPYSRSWHDKNVEISLNDTLTQNNYLHNDFSYKILRPETTVINTTDNSISYEHFIQLGLGVPFSNVKYTSLEANYIFPKGNLGAFYMPEIKSFGAKVGVTIIKFKTKK